MHTPLHTPSISFNGACGRVIINRDAAALLKLSKGDSIQFSFDEASPEDWYIRKTKHDENSITLGKSGGCLVFNSRVLVAKIIEVLNASQNKFYLKINREPVPIDGIPWHLLITADITYYNGRTKRHE